MMQAKHGSKKYNLLFIRQLFIKKITNPAFIFIYSIVWIFVYKLCKYGMLNKNFPVIYGCILLMMFYFIFSTIEYILYYKQEKDSMKKGVSCEFFFDITNEIQIQDEIICCTTDSGKFQFNLNEITDISASRNWLYIFLNRKRFVVVQRTAADEEQWKLLYKILNITNRISSHRNRLLMSVLVLAITISGFMSVYSTTRNYSGKLAWILDGLNTNRSVTLENQNVYQTKFSVMFEEIRQKADLPYELMLVNGFEMDFNADGELENLDTELYGFDSYGTYVNTYVISYDRSQSEEISVKLTKTRGVVYQEERDFDKFREMMDLIPLKETVQPWNKEKYGVLYYGVREWKNSDQGFRFMDENGTIMEELAENKTRKAESGKGQETFRGLTISVFCPDNDREVPPIRYVFPQ